MDPHSAPPQAGGRAPESARGSAAENVGITNVGGDYVDASVTNVINIENRPNVMNCVNNAPEEPTRNLGPYLAELEKHISRGAAYDSFERGGLDAPKCHPETRKAVQERIIGWIGHESQGVKSNVPAMVLWLSGPAGAGKTAIAGSIADLCQAKGWLAGTFFFSAFSGQQDRRSKLYVIPTLAYHLIHQKSIPGLKEGILSAIADNPSVFDKRLREQFEILILEPLRRIPAGVDRASWPKVIIIDGLDECGAAMERAIEDAAPNRDLQEANQKEVVTDVLAQACEDPAFPFRVLITSRPEPAISHVFSTFPAPIVPLFLDDKYNPDADIALFLDSKFAEIRWRLKIPGDWPGKKDIGTLVGNASGQFIYAATVVRYVSSQEGPESPQDRLRRVLEWKTRGDAQPLSALEFLYTNIIATSPNPPLANKWLLAIHKLRTHRSGLWEMLGRRGMEDLLQSFPGETHYLLGNLSSIVNLGPDGDGLSPSFDFYHKSLGDFLEDSGRCAELYPEECEPVRPSPSRLLTMSERVTTNFLAERGRASLKDASDSCGQGISNHLKLAQMPTDKVKFLRRTCTLVSCTISTRPRYDATEVDWWFDCLTIPYKGLFSENLPPCPQVMEYIFLRIHKDCHWYSCRKSCKVWRKGILRRWASTFPDTDYVEEFLGLDIATFAGYRQLMK